MAPPIEELGKVEWQELLNLTAELRADGDYEALEALFARFESKAAPSFQDLFSQSLEQLSALHVLDLGYSS